MTGPVKLALSIVDNCLNTMSDEDALSFWRVLTALRHDDSNSVAKSRTTAHVRKTALPNFFGSGKAGRLRSPGGFGTGIKSITKSQTPQTKYGANGHFDRHLKDAADVLGLSVRRVG